MITNADLLSMRKEFIAGGTAGAIGIFIGFPFDSVKVKIQSNPDLYRSALDCLRQTVKTDGYSGLYRGSLPPVLMQGLINSLIFTGESIATRLLEPNLRPGEMAAPVNSILAGVAGGLCQLVVLVPSEVVKCTMQASTGSATSTIMSIHSHDSNLTRTIKTCRYIYSTQGLSGFYKGTLITALREVPSITTYFITYRTIRKYINQWDGNSNRTSTILIAGAGAGVASWTAMYPIDVIKTNMQVSTQVNSSHSGNNTSVVKVALNLYKAHGFKVFYRGLGTAVARAIPANAVLFYVYEKLKPMIH